MYKALSLASRIRELGNHFIITKLKEHGYEELSPSHGDILIVLYKNSSRTTMQELADRIRRTKSTLTVLIDKLEKLALVKRTKSAEDARVTYIVLTEKGAQLQQVFEQISAELNAMLYRNLSDTESAQLDYLLEKMLDIS